jgi:hypothetical protein
MNINWDNLEKHIEFIDGNFVVYYNKLGYACHGSGKTVDLANIDLKYSQDAFEMFLDETPQLQKKVVLLCN